MLPRVMRRPRLCCGLLAVAIGVVLCSSATVTAGVFSSDDEYCSPWYRFERAGNPQCISRWARPSYGPKYSGYYVGGGATPHTGEGRYECEGTWGVDYAPWYSRVQLNWWHGKYQGGQGQYEQNHKVKPFNRRPR